MAQGGEERGKALRLVDGERPGLPVQEPLEVRLQQRDVRGALEVEMDEAGSRGPHEGALTALAGPHHEDDREGPEQPVQASLGLPGDVSHTLYY
jgi:hypothetical protein